MQHLGHLAVIFSPYLSVENGQNPSQKQFEKNNIYTLWMHIEDQS